MKEFASGCCRWLGRLTALLGLLYGSPEALAVPPTRHSIDWEIPQILAVARAPAAFTVQSNGTPSAVPSADQSVSPQPPPGPAPAAEARSVPLRKWLGALILVTSFYVGFRWIILRRR
ncbi:MAG TPA: hypothetical protein VL527_03110 [Dongiaceae bacterium]|nr:hypothetical protein [Dongiaceae bacterium]